MDSNLIRLLYQMFSEGEVERCSQLSRLVCNLYPGVFPPLEQAILARDNASIKANLIAYLDENCSDGINYRRWFEDDINQFDWVRNSENPALFNVMWLTSTSTGLRQYWRVFKTRQECIDWCENKKHQDKVQGMYICCDLWSKVYRKRVITDWELARL